MKTVSDIREHAELLHTMDRHARMETKKVYKRKLFGLYESVDEIQALHSKLENFQDGDYQIDNQGDLIYGIEIPKHVKSLPEIEDYLTRDYGFIYEDRLCQWCGPFISLNWNHDSRSYFVFDHDTQKPVIESRPRIDHPTISEHDYVSAKIELYMNKTGHYPDAVETDYYGGYNEHFNNSMRNEEESKLEKLIEEYESYEN